MMTILKFHGELVFGNGYRNSESADDLDGSIHIGGADVLSQIANVQFNGPVTVAIADERYSGDLAYELGWGYSEVTPVDDDKLTVGPHDIIARLNQYEAGQIVTMWIADEPFNRLPDELQARIADDERHVTMMLKAADYDALVARLAVAEAERDDLRERHDNLKTAYANLVQEAADRLTRMCSAEAEAARLRDAGRLVQEEVTAWRDSYRDLDEQRLALTARVAELEAQLAAQGWRPVTEKPTASGRYLVWCPAPWPGYEIAPYDRGWGYVDLRFTHWQPLPPAPQEPTP